MLSSLGSTTSFSASGAPAISPTDLYARVSNSLLSKNAAVKEVNASLSQDQTQLSGLGQLQSALSSFQSVTQALAGTGLETGGTSSSPTVLTALTNSNAAKGSYAITVQQLAQAQVLTSAGQNLPNAAIGSGASTKITVDYGAVSNGSFSKGNTASTTVTVDSSDNTLQGIASAFQAAGVDAKVVHGDSGYALVLTAPEGASNTLRLSVSGDSTLQSLLSFDPAGSGGLTASGTPQDAQLSVNGTAVTSASNVVTGAITGTALALTATGSTTLTVAQDNSQIGKNISNFVSAYNALNAKLDSLQSGALKDDGSAASVAAQLASIVKSGSTPSLAQIGITADASGNLQVNNKTLQAAIAANPTAIAGIFTNNGAGVADKLGAAIGQIIDPSGSLQQTVAATENDIASLSSQQAKLMQAVTTQATKLVEQYTNAAAMLNGTSTTGNTSDLFSMLDTSATATTDPLTGYSSDPNATNNSDLLAGLSGDTSAQTAQTAAQAAAAPGGGAGTLFDLFA